jgi:hypothetical protein
LALITATGLGAADRHQRCEDPPLAVRGVRRIRAWPLGRQVHAGVGYRGCGLPGQDMDTQGRAFESGVAVWSLLLLLEGPSREHPDTPLPPTYR